MALARPSLTSLLTLLKLTLLILVPASISTHVIIAKLYTEITGWMKCWVMFSLLGLLEVCVTHRVRGKLAECVKVLVLAWCLAPAPYSGSDLLFSLLPPLHWAVTSLATSAAPCLSCLMELSSEYIIQPASYGAALALAKSIQLVSFLSSEIPVYFWIVIGKLSAILGDIPDLAAVVYSSISTWSVQAAAFIATCAVHVYTCIVTCVGHAAAGLMALTSVIQNVGLSTAAYYQENQRNPRLISSMVRQMVRFK